MFEAEKKNAGHKILRIPARRDCSLHVADFDLPEDFGHRFRVPPHRFPHREEDPLQHGGERDQRGNQKRPHHRPAFQE